MGSVAKRESLLEGVYSCLLLYALSPRFRVPTPAVVIAAHARPESLGRLLATLKQARIGVDATSPVDLVISIDGGSPRTPEVVEIANRFAWSHGSREVIEHDRVGLIGNFHSCGDLTERFGSVVLLEDDLLVGPYFHHWATAGLSFAEEYPEIGGLCLSAPWFDGYRHLPFEPVIDGSDAFYAQVPWFHGMAWTEAMWKNYRAGVDAASTTAIHASFDELAGDEWFPAYVRYLVANDLTFMFPRASHATNSGDAGTHFAEPSDFFQVPLSLGAPEYFNLRRPGASLARYDDHLELDAAVVAEFVPDVDQEELVVDLLGVRDLRPFDGETWVVTTRPVREARRQWGASLHPLPMNLAYGTPGSVISLARVSDVINDRWADTTSRAALTQHAQRGRATGISGTARSVGERLALRARAAVAEAKGERRA